MTDPAQGRVSRADRTISALFLALAAVCAGGAFVGLAASSYWIDELFSLFVVDHAGGQAEVLRRALTDTHPPAYYLIIHEWIGLFGASETATRAFSAICAVAALPALFLGLRGTFSLPARSFATAMAAGSKTFFEQSQNMRSYGLSLLVSTGLLALTLAIHRRLRGGAGFPAAPMAAFWALGLFGAFVHFYIFLAVGMAHLFLLVSARTARARAVIVVSGLIIAAAMGAYVISLLGASQQDLQDMWFSNKVSVLAKQALGGVTQSWSGLAIPAVILLALAPWVDRQRAASGRGGPPIPYVPAASVQLCGLVILGTVVSGLVVSFVVAPSFGKRNLLVLAPFFWAVAAWLYDAVGPDWRRTPSRILIGFLVVAMAGNAVSVRARTKPRNEEWRASAAYVAGAPGCAEAPMPVVLPFLFGPSTPFFRDLARERFFGRYDARPARLIPLVPREFADKGIDPTMRALLTARATGQDACPVLVWAVHDVEWSVANNIARAVAESTGVSIERLRIRSFSNYKVGLLGFTSKRQQAFVIERRPTPVPPSVAVADQ